MPSSLYKITLMSDLQMQTDSGRYVELVIEILPLTENDVLF